MAFNRQALAWHRVQRGWTQADLAKKVGLSRPYVNQIEGGVREPSPHALAALAEVLEVPIADFLQRTFTCPHCGETSVLE